MMMVVLPWILLILMSGLVNYRMLLLFIMCLTGGVLLNYHLLAFLSRNRVSRWLLVLVMKTRLTNKE
jgi:hypothetical protein